MGLKNTRSRPWLSRLHFLVRLLGLTGLLAAGVGLVMAEVQGLLWAEGQPWRQAVADAGQRLLAALRGQAAGDSLAQATTYVFLAGTATALLALLVEVVGVLRFTAVRRSAFGFNALLQAALAAALLIGVNVYSFQHFERLDCTRDTRFTLSREVRDQLRGLRGETTIVVLQQRRKTELADDQFEDYDAAAEAVLIEKVRDLAEQLRGLSEHNFRVVILDARKKEYRNELARVTDGQPELARAIKEAPENSLFFYAKDDKGKAHVQRLSFDAFYQLDKTKSRQAGGGRGNLVLLNKGVEPLARRIMNLEERKPRVGVLVVDPLLSTQGTVELFTLAGLRKTLTEHGFEVRDVILKSDTTGQPTADTFEERRVAELQDTLDVLNQFMPNLEKGARRFEGLLKELPKANLAEFSRKYAAELRGARLTRESQRRELLEIFQEELTRINESLKAMRRQHQETTAELSKLDADAARAQSRERDVRGKLGRLLADCDLLIIPRYTRLAMGAIVADDVNELFRLDNDQTAAVRAFLRKGKPILACLGPINDPAEPAPGRKDSLEQLLAQLGVYCSGQTVLFDTQVQDFARQGRRGFQRVTLSPVPGLDFSSTPKTLRAGRSNPLHESLRLTEGLLGAKLDVRLRYLRPIYADPDRGAPFPARLRPQVGAMLAGGPLGALALAAAAQVQAEAGPAPEFAPEFLWTSADSWNDDKPFPTAERPVPRYQPPGPEDPNRGTPDEKRRGPFPVGVAVVAPVPADWYPEGKGRTVRVAVIGHGGVFVDPVLPPARQKLLLDTCNWLLGRDDLLTREAAVWQYPRLDLSPGAKKLWLRGTRLGLPVLFAFLGLVVVLARRVR